MKKKFDFVFHDYMDEERCVFRFYPKKSHIHGYGDKPPKTWSEVYKTHLCYSVLYQTNFTGKGWKTKVLYKEKFDENGCLRRLAYILNKIIKGVNENDKYSLYPFGDGSEWRIQKDGDNWEIMLFDNYIGNGFKMNISLEEIKEFCKTIDNFLEYMLNHSEGI